LSLVQVYRDRHALDLHSESTRSAITPCNAIEARVSGFLNIIFKLREPFLSLE
jgi:hypothetical protein